MPTRVYFPSSGAAPITPADWEFGEQVNPLTFAGSLFPSGTPMTTKTEATGVVSPIFRGMLRYVYGPLRAVTLNGWVRGQMGGSESNAAANATLALAIKFVQPDGSDRGVLLAPTGSDSTTTAWELAGTLTNARFTNLTEQLTIPLTQQAAQDGDYLVIEIGFRSATTTTRNISLRYGDAAAADLPEDTISTTDLNPWLEFTGNFELQHSLSATELAILSASVCAGGNHRVITTNLGNFDVANTEILDSAPEDFEHRRDRALGVWRHLYWGARAKGMSHPQALASLISSRIWL